jgi:hypothetical protein
MIPKGAEPRRLTLQHAFIRRVSYPQRLGGFWLNLLLRVYTETACALGTASWSCLSFMSFGEERFCETLTKCVCFSSMFCVNFRVSKNRECCTSVTRVRTTRKWGERERTSRPLHSVAAELFLVMCFKLITNCYWYYHVLRRGIPRIVSLQDCRCSPWSLPGFSGCGLRTDCGSDSILPYG